MRSRVRSVAEVAQQARQEQRVQEALASDPCPGLKRLPDSDVLRIDAEAERDLWRLDHALEAPPDGNCYIFSVLAHVT